MTENTGLTAEERNSLRLWFRQAIAQVEIETATASMLKFYAPEKQGTHRVSTTRKRPLRKLQDTHTRELAY